MPLDDDHLRGVLRAEADRHTPDREAMLERIERGRPASRFPRVLRPAAAALAVVVVVATVVAGVRRADAPDPRPPIAASPVPTLRFSTPSPVRGKGLSAVGKRDAHSFASWSQQQVTLHTDGEIRRLDVTIRIARSEQVADTGRWTSIPAEMVSASIAVEQKALIYRFTLKPGGTLAPGSYVFAAQFNHAIEPRALTGDAFTIVAGGVTLTGGFSA
ncbi:hypothetical protein Aab01nite_30980 [Paractinoplanes abujensis]|uniref:Uncharacterized protein n=1 Tax=Paractinoplanes abujensis TaxID=882441 RepID=A0A7W7D0G0_9ACTN|nr:hypothetical protein [Actinoplanes abujensis]MBB4698008.1 hypothetical protein [Actinoplanes abujensis]GID19508.1 hypothetical protein Aab01nite_30980 [Actinoplanes abujensis]